MAVKAATGRVALGFVAGKRGGRGADTLLGVAGNDRLDAKNNDSLDGSSGNDACRSDVRGAAVRCCPSQGPRQTARCTSISRSQRTGNDIG